MPMDELDPLLYALAAETRASARLEAYAAKAELDGLPGLARLFRAAALAQDVHARRFLRLARGKISSSAENLRCAWQEDIPGHAGAYPELIAQAQARGQGAAATALGQSLAVEQANLERLRQAGLNGPEALAYQVCQVCGHTVEGEPPERCPLCGALPEKFQAVR